MYFWEMDLYFLLFWSFHWSFLKKRLKFKKVNYFFYSRNGLDRDGRQVCLPVLGWIWRTAHPIIACHILLAIIQKSSFPPWMTSPIYSPNYYSDSLINFIATYEQQNSDDHLSGGRHCYLMSSKQFPFLLIYFFYYK